MLACTLLFAAMQGSDHQHVGHANCCSLLCKEATAALGTLAESRAELHFHLHGFGEKALSEQAGNSDLKSRFHDYLSSVLSASTPYYSATLSLFYVEVGVYSDRILSEQWA